jgi:hypothetical protein
LIFSLSPKMGVLTILFERGSLSLSVRRKQDTLWQRQEKMMQKLPLANEAHEWFGWSLLLRRMMTRQALGKSWKRTDTYPGFIRTRHSSSIFAFKQNSQHFFFCDALIHFQFNAMGTLSCWVQKSLLDGKILWFIFFYVGFKL